MFEGNGCFGFSARRGLSVPGMGDDDVVEGRMALAEARETDFENHGRMVLMCCFWIYRENHLSPLQDMTFAMRERMPRTAIPAGCGHQLSASPLELHISPTVSLPFTLTFCLSLLLSHMIDFWIRKCLQS
jgi:hypothetical protein